LNQFDYFVGRTAELNQIQYALQHHNRVLIEGQPGIGKTSLLRMFVEMNPLNYKNIFYLYGYELELDKTKLTSLRNSLKSDESSYEFEKLWIIDEFESIISPEMKNEVLSIVKEGKKHNDDIIISSRPLIENEIIKNNGYTILLSGFTQQEFFTYLAQSVDDSFSAKITNQATLLNIYEVLNGSPLGLNYAFEFLKNNNTPINQIKDLLENKILHNTLIFDNSKRSINEDSPESKKILSDITNVNSQLIERVSKNPKLIYQLSSRKFEELVAEILTQKGFKVTLTKETRDGGKDIFLAEENLLGNFLFYVECKRYQAHIPVGVKIVRELYGTISVDRATAGILVTSSYFSPDAKEYREKIKNQISLIDFMNLQQWLNSLKR
jgi:restriction system protein